MKRILCLFLCVIFAVTLCSCGNGGVSTEQEDAGSLIVLEKGFDYVIFQHKDTGVCYIRVANIGVLPLFNADGTFYTGENIHEVG